MELLAIISSLEYIKEKSDIIIYSDSSYITNSFNKGWIYSWGENDFLHNRLKDLDNKNNKELINFLNTNLRFNKTCGLITKSKLSNKTLWQKLINQIYEKANTIKFIKVSSHKSDFLNNLCDYLAKNEVLQEK